MSALVDGERNAAMLAWYAEHGRELPWRGTDDPYRVMVSEVMLQQTQAARVIVPYQRFIAQFPTVGALAAAPLATVLDAWSGLGYNTRARRLREAARIIVADGWPTSVQGLEALPGVGPYTAAAIGSFAFDAQVATVDTNVRRVLSRWNGEPLDGAALAAAAGAALGSPAADWNQAVMDLGATICVARGARCAECPVSDWCPGPQGYVPTTAQAKFEGSFRQLRGAVVRAVLTGPQTTASLAERSGFPLDTVELAIEDLVEEGMLIDRADGYAIAD